MGLKGVYIVNLSQSRTGKLAKIRRPLYFVVRRYQRAGMRDPFPICESYERIGNYLFFVKLLVARFLACPCASQVK